jgi:hypothetical protein
MLVLMTSDGAINMILKRYKCVVRYNILEQHRTDIVCLLKRVVRLQLTGAMIAYCFAALMDSARRVPTLATAAAMGRLSSQGLGQLGL